MRRTVVRVSGKGNTGKTTAIRSFLASRDIHSMHKGDVTIIVPLLCGYIAHMAGIASGGDNLPIVNRNIAFFLQYGPEFLVFASKSEGKTFDRIAEFAEETGAELVSIRTKYCATKIKQQADRDRIVDEISVAFRRAAAKRARLRK